MGAGNISYISWRGNLTPHVWKNQCRKNEKKHIIARIPESAIISIPSRERVLTCLCRLPFGENKLKGEFHEIFCFRFFSGGKLIHKKTWCRKSRGTLPLIVQCELCRFKSRTETLCLRSSFRTRSGATARPSWYALCSFLFILSFP